MTILEIILIGVLWVAYGVFSTYQSWGNTFSLDDNEGVFELILGIILAPVILVVRIFLGIFHKCTMNI